MSPISKSLRQEVAHHADFRCEYCFAPEIIGISMHIDHIIPLVHGGSDEPENLCYACDRCNASKQAFQTGNDPQTGDEVPLFNPRIAQWSEHFRFSDNASEIIGQTSIGRATVERLDLNHKKRVTMRLLWVQLNLFPPQPGE